MYDSTSRSIWKRSSSSSSDSTTFRLKSERRRRRKSLSITAPLHALDDLGDDGTEPAPGRDLLVKPRPPASGQLVVLRAPVVVRRAPRRLDPPAALQSMKRRIQGALADIQGCGRDLMEALRDCPPVSRLERQRFQNQEIECALGKIELVC